MEALAPRRSFQRSVLDKERVKYLWVEIDREPSAVEVVLQLNAGYRTVPTIVLPYGRVLVQPSRRELEDSLAGPETAA